MAMHDPVVDKLDEVKGVLEQYLPPMLAELIRIRTLAEAATLPPAALLAQEFLTYTDLDGGKGAAGSIYGVDFQIRGPDTPPLLLPLRQHPEWRDPEVVLSWAQYLAS